MKKGVDKQHLFLYYMLSSAAVHYRKQNNDAWLSLVERCVRDAEGSQGPVDLGFEPTEAERRPQVQILSHRFLAGALESRKAFQFFCCFLHSEMLS